MGKRKTSKKKKASSAFARLSASPFESFNDILEEDPLTGYPASVRHIQGFQATKRYICPECNDAIVAGTQHFVVVPIDAPDLRRHWHSYCWSRRSNRTPRTSKKRRKA